MSEKQALLSVEGVETYYGNIRALSGVTVHADPGEIVALIGANGAGKSTLMMTIFGMPRARTGRVIFDGKDITQLPTHEIARLRIAQSPEGRRIFPRMTVQENLQMGASLDKLEFFDEDSRMVFDLFPRLKEREKQKAGTMSGGEQQMLAIGRALMANPKLLLLDEPSMGLAPVLVERIYETVAEINEQGTTILLVEQNANFALEVSERAYVLETGTIALSDKASALRENPEVQKAYLGA
jgi:branched-chain amino acid transport system ATP-binding protein